MNQLFISADFFQMIFIICLLFLPWIYSLYHVLTNRRLNRNQKWIWSFVVVFSHLFGVALYWFWGRKGNEEESEII